MKTNLIGISGKIGSGKDTVGKIIQIFNPEYQIKKFADKLKERIALTWNIERQKLEDQDFKNTLVPQLRITWRQLMQLEGESMRRIDLNYWCKALFNDYRRSLRNVKDISTSGMRTSMLQADYPSWLITDVRYPNEVKAIEDRDGIVIRVDRDVKLVDHESETALDNYDFKYRIDNNGTIEQLVEKVKNLDVLN